METYTQSDVSNLFHVSRSTIWRWVRNSQLPAPTQIGRRLVWRKDIVDALLDEDHEVK